MKICHLTSVHSRFDTRIYLKQCCSLAAAGYDVHLVVADSKGAEIQRGVSIDDVGRVQGRITRMRQTSKRLLEKAVVLDAEIYHLHDPELIPIGLKLKQRGKKVIFDAHEDLPKQIFSKPYLNPLSRWLLSRIFAFYEARVCGRFDAIVTATPAIRDKFLHLNPRTVDINNFPILGELAVPTTTWENRKPHVCYIGGIAALRGIREMVHAMEHVRSDVRLQLAGNFFEPSVEEEVRTYPGWNRVDTHGFVDREGVKKILSKAVGGMVVLHPAKNFLDSLPIKMFEYMSTGLPIIASAFPLWREIIDRHQCGICVDPLDSAAIGRAIDSLLERPDEAEAMGVRGKEAVAERFNWKSEEGKLIELYDHLSRAS
ncbi:MAG: glycosyltransferase family 4 protein [Desulfobulbus sp.]|nr:glycosyltransferase family 4 protein [Desulfobulbus sp.]